MASVADQKKHILDADDPRHGATAQPVLYMFLVALAEILIWIWCNNQQIQTSHDAIFALLQAKAVLPAHATGQQVLSALTAMADTNNRIASTVAWVTQIIFLMIANPLSRTWSQFNKKHGYHPTGSGWRGHVAEVRRHLSIRRALFIVFFVYDVWSDLTYVSLTSHAVEVQFIYILALFAGSTYVGLDGWQRLMGAVMAMKNSRKFDEKGAASPNAAANQ